MDEIARSENTAIITTMGIAVLFFLFAFAYKKHRDSKKSKKSSLSKNQKHAMKKLFFLILLIPLLSLQAQEQDVIEAIRKDIWIPFMESYAELDSEKLQSIHSKDIVRVLIDQNKVQSGQKYLDDFGGFLNQVKENGGNLGIAFALLTTAVNDAGDLAYQTGYYEFSSKNKNDQNLMIRGYGYFSVGLIKIEDSWKLFLDSDKRIDLTLEEFEKQKIVYRLEQ